MDGGIMKWKEIKKIEMFGTCLLANNFEENIRHERKNWIEEYTVFKKLKHFEADLGGCRDVSEVNGKELEEIRNIVPQTG